MMSRISVFPRSFAARMLGVAMLAGMVAFAQQPEPYDPAAPPTEPVAQQQTLSPQQLDDLVAPIALYPDPLLSQVLVACTYPLEVVEAQQWLQRNRGLQGTALMDAAKQQNWDASVQALVAMPDVLARLNSDVRWTTDLGNAFLGQQADVMAAVQRMRTRAQANGKLGSNAQETVTTQTQGGQSAIVIEPANPDIIYAPVYDPMWVWGPPAWGFYPPLYYPAFGFGWGPGFNIGLCFGGWGGWGFGGWGGWGWGPNWFGRSVIVNNTFFHHYGFHGGYGYGGGFGGRTVWAHDPMHRMGVAYPNRQLTARYAGSRFQAGAHMGSGSLGNYAGRNSFGGSRNSFGGGRNSLGASRNSFGAPQSAGREFGNRPGVSGSGYQRFGGSSYAGRSVAPPATAGQRFGGGNSYSAPRSFGGGGVRSFAPGNSAPRFNGGGFSGGTAPRFNGGSAPRSFGGGGRSVGGFGGGGHAFSGGGGGFHGGGGGGFHGGGGGGGFHGGGGGGGHHR